MTDHYEELGVEPTASKDEIRDAHRARLSELEAARARKGVSDSQLQANREEAARVRGAWNVLSDPMQRQRYDQQLMDERAGNGDDAGSDVELVDDDSPAAPAPTGWRKLLAPPPAKDTGTRGATGKAGAAGREPKAPARPNRPPPTVELPAGTELATSKARGMALAFDLAICIVLAFICFNFIPSLIQSDYKDIVDQVAKVQSVHDDQQSVNDAQQSLDSAKSSAAKKSAQKDLTSAQKDLTKAEKDAKKAGVTPATAASGKKRVTALEDQMTKLSDKIRTTQLVVTGLLILLVLAYLVPITAITGHTFGMKNRGIKVIRVDGSPCSWYASFVRFAIPVVIAVALTTTGSALSTIGPMIGLGMVLWGFRDRNGQGVHDKLARTLVVTA
jgi:curved DNA-binding protein CbpA/uncharacterized RDD family membrane protein YckC